MWATLRHFFADTAPQPDPDKQAALDAQEELRRRLKLLGIEVAVVTHDRRRVQQPTRYRRRADDDDHP